VKNEQALLRRDVLVGLGVAAVGVGAGAAVDPLLGTAAADARPLGSAAPEAAAQAVSPLALPDLTPDVQALFGSIGPGTRIGDAIIASVHGVRHGAVPVILEQGGRRFAVEVFREEAGGAPPVVRAAGLSLFLVNDGTGYTPTSESHGLAVIALGRALAERRSLGAAVPEALAPRSSRIESDASYEISVG
jgi:hypothetical protein